MTRRLGFIAVLLSVSVFVSGQSLPVRGLVAHEWGTFTSIAGEDGRRRAVAAPAGSDRPARFRRAASTAA